MALYSPQDLMEWLDLEQEVALKVFSLPNRVLATEEVRRDVGEDKYDDVKANQSQGDGEYDRIAAAEALRALAAYLGNRGALRLSRKGGLVQDIGLINQQQTIRKLLSQGQVEKVQSRLRSQAEDLLGDLIRDESQVWAI